jgi:hypothetical protein
VVRAARRRRRRQRHLRASPTSADTGTLIFDQTTFNLDFRGSLDWGVGDEQLYLATGAEYRRENYEIQAGDVWSCRMAAPTIPRIPILDQTGDPAAPASRVSPASRRARKSMKAATATACTPTPKPSWRRTFTSVPRCASRTIPTSAPP